MRTKAQEAGVVLAVTLFMLALLSIIGISAVTLTTTHFRLTGNLQQANEIEMALRSAIEEAACPKLNGLCDPNPVKQDCKSVNRCVNGHVVNVQIRLRCIGAAYGSPSGGSLSTGSDVLDTYWDLEGTVTNDPFGSKMVVHWGLVTPQQGKCLPKLSEPSCPAPTDIICP